MKKTFAVLLVVFSICWIFYILMEDRDSIVQFYEEITTKTLLYIVLSLVLGSIGVFQYVLIWREIINRQYGEYFDIKYLSNLYFTSQIVRYLPGRFFGVVYQTVKAKKKIPALVIIKSNAELMVFNVFFHFIVSILLLVFCYGGSYCISGVVSFIVLVVIAYIYMYLDLFYVVSSFVCLVIPKKYDWTKLYLETHRKYSTESNIRIIIFYILSWGFYLFGWVTISFIFPDIGIKESIIICANYTISWIVGFVSMLTPGGMGVREGVFVYISSFFSITTNLVFLAVFIRVWLIAIDLILVVVSISLNMSFKKNHT